MFFLRIRNPWGKSPIFASPFGRNSFGSIAKASQFLPLRSCYFFFGLWPFHTLDILGFQLCHRWIVVWSLCVSGDTYLRPTQKFRWMWGNIKHLIITVFKEGTFYKSSLSIHWFSSVWCLDQYHDFLYEKCWKLGWDETFVQAWLKAE